MWELGVWDVFRNLITITVIAYVLGYGFLPAIEYAEKNWKTKKRSKRWMACSYLLVITAVFFKTLFILVLK
jgi:hypothetical protein